MMSLEAYAAVYLLLIAAGYMAWSAARGARTLERRLLRSLSGALAAGDIYLVYQPKLELRTGTVAGVEALLRWSHPRLGQIGRDVLIPLAERHGRIRELTTWVLRRALRDQRILAAEGQIMPVHINVSAGLLIDAEFIASVIDLAESRCGDLGLEITETVFIDNPEVAMANLGRLTRMGITVSIDDYGSGMSSLAYLKDLPAQELKIDKMFISGMTTSHRDPLIVRSTIDLAHALGLRVVAEGVESPATLALLRVMGCDFAQGFVISPGLAINELRPFLRNHRPVLGEVIGIRPPQSFWQRTTLEPEVDKSVIAK